MQADFFLPQTFVPVKQHGREINGCYSDIKTSDKGLDDTVTRDEPSVGINAEIHVNLRQWGNVVKAGRSGSEEGPPAPRAGPARSGTCGGTWRVVSFKRRLPWY